MSMTTERCSSRSRSAGDGVVAQDLTPFGDGPVRGHDDRGLQIPLVDDLEQGGRGFGGQREVAQLSPLCRCRHDAPVLRSRPTCRAIAEIDHPRRRSAWMSTSSSCVSMKRGPPE